MLHYQIEFDDYRQHLIHVTARFLANPNQVLWLPSWMRQMESAFDAFVRHEERLQKLSGKPSEILRRQTINPFGMGVDDRLEAQLGVGRRSDAEGAWHRVSEIEHRDLVVETRRRRPLMRSVRAVTCASRTAQSPCRLDNIS